MKNQNGKINATLLFSIVVIALAAYVFFFDYKKGQQDEEQKKKDSKVFAGLELEKIKDLSISPDASAPEKLINLVKKGADWQIVKPVNDIADKDAVETFLKTLLDEKTQDSVGDTKDLKTFGLDQPKGSIALTPNDGPSVLVDIGSVKAYDGSLYAKILNKSGVYLLSSVWGAYIDKKPNEFRLKRVERAHFRDWTQVQTKVSGKPHLNLKKVDDHWESTPKSEIPLQLNLVEGFIFQMANLEVLDFVDETKLNLAKHGLAQPDYEVALMGEQDKKPHDFKLQLSKKSPDNSKQTASATSSELSGVVKVYSSILDVAARGVEYFFDRKYPFQYDPTQAAKVKIKTAELNLTAQKKDGKWVKIDSNSKGELQSSGLEELTRALSRMETSNYLTEKGSGLEPAKNLIEVANDKGELLTRVVWGGEYKDKNLDPANLNIKFYYAKTSKVPKYTLTIKQTALDELMLSKLFAEATKASPSPATSTKEAHP